MSKELGDKIIAYDYALRHGPEGTYALWRRWDPLQRLGYINHMERLARTAPEKHPLFSDIVAIATAYAIGG